MRIVCLTLMASLLVLLSSNAFPDSPVMIQNESGEEIAELHFLINRQGIGTVVVLPCPACDTYTLKVTAASRAFRNHKPIAMTKVSSIEKDAAIFYYSKSKIVDRIYLQGEIN